MTVSIHAPAKGATCGLLRVHTRAHVSIHAPAKGATLHGEPTDIKIGYTAILRTIPHGPHRPKHAEPDI